MYFSMELIKAWHLEDQPIPFDMASKYCDKRLREAFMKNLLLESRVGMHVTASKAKDFWKFVLEPEVLREWRETYAGGSKSRKEQIQHE